MSVPHLSPAERKRLRGRAHPLHPIAQVGRQGVSPAFLAEVDRALASHELIKIRLRGERDDRAEQLREVADQLSCATVATVGGVAVLFRQGDAVLAEDEEVAAEGADVAELATLDGDDDEDGDDDLDADEDDLDDEDLDDDDDDEEDA